MNTKKTWNKPSVRELAIQYTECHPSGAYNPPQNNNNNNNSWGNWNWGGWGWGNWNWGGWGKKHK